MKTRKDRAPREAAGEEADAWDPERNPALRELLDHIAQQLAQEYVELMKEHDSAVPTVVQTGKRRKHR